MRSASTRESDLALDWLRLLSHPDNAHAALSDLLQKPVGADLRARTLQRDLLLCRFPGQRSLFVERARLFVRRHEHFYMPT